MHSPEYYLTHYFHLLFEKNGLKWDSDNSTEMTCLAEAITAPLQRRITELEQDLAAFKTYVLGRFD